MDASGNKVSRNDLRLPAYTYLHKCYVADANSMLPVSHAGRGRQNLEADHGNLLDRKLRRIYSHRELFFQSLI